MTTLNPERLYLGDNGRSFCGADRCAGASASMTGRDLSGQRVHRVAPEDVAEHDRIMRDEYGRDLPLACEGCGREAGHVAGTDGGAVLL